MDTELFVQNVKSYCKTKGVKPTVACAECGAGKDMLNKLRSRGSLPSVEKVQMLAEYLGCTVSDLLGEERPDAAAPSVGERRLVEVYRSVTAQGQQELLDHAAYIETRYGKNAENPSQPAAV